MCHVTARLRDGVGMHVQTPRRQKRGKGAPDYGGSGVAFRGCDITVPLKQHAAKGTKSRQCTKVRCSSLIFKILNNQSFTIRIKSTNPISGEDGVNAGCTNIIKTGPNIWRGWSEYRMHKCLTNSVTLTSIEIEILITEKNNRLMFHDK
ncbi:hypothetical protein SESBI_08976 [Sesbania bispinosa]|nr:hypothetical protein SESBI_08976 [Sesbania bispinosa]